MDITTLPALKTELVDLHARLNRQDANLTRAAATPNPPTPGWGISLALSASMLSDVRDGVATLVPNSQDLTARLAQDALNVSRSSGRLDIMARHKVPLSPIWGKALDSSIGTTKDALTAVERLINQPTPKYV